MDECKIAVQLAYSVESIFVKICYKGGLVGTVKIIVVSKKAAVRCAGGGFVSHWLSKYFFKKILYLKLTSKVNKAKKGDEAFEVFQSIGEKL